MPKQPTRCGWTAFPVVILLTQEYIVLSGGGQHLNYKMVGLIGVNR